MFECLEREISTVADTWRCLDVALRNAKEQLAHIHTHTRRKHVIGRQLPDLGNVLVFILSRLFGRMQTRMRIKRQKGKPQRARFWLLKS